MPPTCLSSILHEYASRWQRDGCWCRHPISHITYFGKESAGRDGGVELVRLSVMVHACGASRLEAKLTCCGGREGVSGAAYIAMSCSVMVLCDELATAQIELIRVLHGGGACAGAARCRWEVAVLPPPAATILRVIESWTRRRCVVLSGGRAPDEG
jgi:hypothetical protein